jgi:hypothetical protein
VIPVILFGAAFVADLVSTWVATERGIRERNPILRLTDPVLGMIVLSVLLVAPAEICRAAGLSGWTDGLYLGGTVPHLAAAVVNIVAIAKKGK